MQCGTTTKVGHEKCVGCVCAWEGCGGCNLAGQCTVSMCKSTNRLPFNYVFCITLRQNALHNNVHLYLVYIDVLYVLENFLGALSFISGTHITVECAMRFYSESVLMSPFSLLY